MQKSTRPVRPSARSGHYHAVGRRPRLVLLFLCGCSADGAWNGSWLTMSGRHRTGWPARGICTILTLVVVALWSGCTSFSRVPEQTYLGGSYNWAFRNRYPQSDRLFNAFDYGHAILYDRLLRDEGKPDAAVRDIDGREFEFITTQLLVHPPSLPLDEHAIAPTYATFVPELLEVFGWTHMLHRQIYDVLADPRLDSAARDVRVAELLRYYGSRRDLALSMLPKSMDLM